MVHLWDQHNTVFQQSFFLIQRPVLLNIYYWNLINSIPELISECFLKTRGSWFKTETQLIQSNWFNFNKFNTWMKMTLLHPKNLALIHNWMQKSQKKKSSWCLIWKLYFKFKTKVALFCWCSVDTNVNCDRAISINCYFTLFCLPLAY